MTTTIKLYHGTSSKNLNDIMESGAEKLYLTIDDEQASYYAEQASEEDGTEQCVIVVEIPIELLVADLPSFNEPISFILKYHNMNEDEWHKAINENTIRYPDSQDWKTSLKYTKNVIAIGDIKKEYILGLEASLNEEDELKIDNLIHSTSSKKYKI